MSCDFTLWSRTILMKQHEATLHVEHYYTMGETLPNPYANLFGEALMLLQWEQGSESLMLLS